MSQGNPLDHQTFEEVVNAVKATQLDVSPGSEVDHDNGLTARIYDYTGEEQGRLLAKMELGRPASVVFLIDALFMVLLSQGAYSYQEATTIITNSLSHAQANARLNGLVSEDAAQDPMEEVIRAMMEGRDPNNTTH